MSELQESNGITYQEDEVIENDAVVEESELATDTEEAKPEPQGSVDGIEIEGPDGFKKAIDKQHKKFREQERRANDLEQRLKDFESRQPALEDVVVPPIPDSWDENYEAKIRQRDEAFRKQAQNEFASTQRRERQAATEHESQRAEYDRTQALQKQFAANTQKLGLKEDELMTAQNAVVEYGVTPELANALLEDSDGPLMVQYLAANPLDLYDITQASPLKAGLLLAKVKAKSAGLRKKVSAAPDPADSLSGRAVPKKDRGPKGATYT
tara:strand:- start:88 stop:891 length:804 start_codon:yes stop_codon:yes gene_type:complete